MSNEVRIEVPCELIYRDVAAGVIRQLCVLAMEGSAQTPFEHQVISAFNEAFNNIAKHGCSEGQAEGQIGPVTITAAIDEGLIEIRIASFGGGFEGPEDEQFELEALPESGMGLFIMRSFMDVLEFTKGTGDTPDVVCMKKSF